MYRVLVADDEARLREALISGVDWAALGFAVVGAAANGAEALEMVEALDPDLLLTDIQMPFVSGTELARRAREIRPNLFIAFISGHDDFSFAQEGIRHGVVSYILRPVSSAEMTAELTRIREKMDARKPPAPDAARQPCEPSVVSRALAIIERDYGDESLNLSTVAERLHVSVSHFCAVFKKERGDTFVNALTRRRMERAKELLLSTRMSISEIAGMCGYSDIFYFSYCFKKYHKQAPSKLRTRDA